MGKSTLVTRRGVGQYTLATGECDIGQEYFGCPAAMRKRTPCGRQDVSGQKPFGCESLQMSVPGAPSSARLGGSLFASTPGHFSRVAEGAAGVVLRADGITPIRP